MTIVSFALLLLGSLGLASGLLNETRVSLYFVTIVCASLGIFALRGLKRAKHPAFIQAKQLVAAMRRSKE